MNRISTIPRKDWETKVEKLGFGFHSTESSYWDESAYYEFSLKEILTIERATNELWEMCLKAVQHVIDNKLYNKFHIPELFISHIENSWENDDPSIYGRFDLAYNNSGEIKMLEFNADTPTSLFEAAIVQWFWLQDFDKTKDQFNSLHEALINYWKEAKPYLKSDLLHFTCVRESLEDITTIEYLRDCAIQADLKTKLIMIDEIGWMESKKVFVDLENEEIENIFKLYPWEWLIHEEFGKNILTDNNKTFWIEPSWKMILSNKAILPVLWELFPNHEYLLESYFEKKHLFSYVKKPILSREGANVEVVKYGTVVEKTNGEYGEEGYIYQKYFELPKFDGFYNILGSWVIGQQAVGISVRCSKSLITNNQSLFSPHLIV